MFLDQNKIWEILSLNILIYKQKTITHKEHFWTNILLSTCFCSSRTFCSPYAFCSLGSEGIFFIKIWRQIGKMFFFVGKTKIITTITGDWTTKRMWTTKILVQIFTLSVCNDFNYHILIYIVSRHLWRLYKYHKSKYFS